MFVNHNFVIIILSEQCVELRRSSDIPSHTLLTTTTYSATKAIVWYFS